MHSSGTCQEHLMPSSIESSSLGTLCLFCTGDGFVSALCMDSLPTQATQLWKYKFNWLTLKKLFIVVNPVCVQQLLLLFLHLINVQTLEHATSSSTLSGTFNAKFKWSSSKSVHIMSVVSRWWFGIGYPVWILCLTKNPTLKDSSTWPLTLRNECWNGFTLPSSSCKLELRGWREANTEYWDPFLQIIPTFPPTPISKGGNIEIQTLLFVQS